MFKLRNFKIIAFVLTFLLLLISCQQLGEEIAKPENQKIIQNAIDDYLSESKTNNQDNQNSNENENTVNKDNDKPVDRNNKLDKNASYYSKDDVFTYLMEYGELPPNYLTKSEARKLGWDASSGNLWDVTDKGVIGGDRFGNREGNLPTKKGRQYFEADVNYEGGRRNAHRLVYSNDGLIFYTDDHYNTFEKLAGE